MQRRRRRRHRRAYAWVDKDVEELEEAGRNRRNTGSNTDMDMFNMWRGARQGETKLAGKTSHMWFNMWSTRSNAWVL
jgi:hypothetical protein